MAEVQQRGDASRLKKAKVEINRQRAERLENRNRRKD